MMNSKIVEAVFGEIIEGVTYKERPSIYGLLIHDSQIGVIAVDGKEGYFLPGGGKEAAESEEGCLKRECIEELGYTIKIGTFIGMAEQNSYSKQLGCYLRVIAQYFQIQLVKEVEGKIDVDHHLIWINLSEASGYMALEHHSWAIQKFLTLPTNERLLVF